MIQEFCSLTYLFFALDIIKKIIWGLCAKYDFNISKMGTNLPFDPLLGSQGSVALLNGSATPLERFWRRRCCSVVLFGEERANLGLRALLRVILALRPKCFFAEPWWGFSTDTDLPCKVRFNNILVYIRWGFKKQ